MSSTVKGKLLLKEELGPASIEEDLRCFIQGRFMSSTVEGKLLLKEELNPASIKRRLLLLLLKEDLFLLALLREDF